MHLACMFSVFKCMIQQSFLLQIQAHELIAPTPSIAQPVIMLEHYKAFVRQNANLINAIEGGLSSLTWLLPDRFSNSELRLEAINSVLGLLSLVHESILEEEPPAMSKQQTPLSFWLGVLKQVSNISSSAGVYRATCEVPAGFWLISHTACLTACLVSLWGVACAVSTCFCCSLRAHWQPWQSAISAMLAWTWHGPITVSVLQGSDPSFSGMLQHCTFCVQVEVLVEIGAINLEGKTGLTRYQPLAVLEAAKYVLAAVSSDSRPAVLPVPAVSGAAC